MFPEVYKFGSRFLYIWFYQRSTKLFQKSILIRKRLRQLENVKLSCSSLKSYKLYPTTFYWSGYQHHMYHHKWRLLHLSRFNISVGYNNMRVIVPEIIIVYYVRLSIGHFKEKYQLKLDTSLKYVNHFLFKSTKH